MFHNGSDGSKITCVTGARTVALLGSFVHHVPETPATDSQGRETGRDFQPSPMRQDAWCSQHQPQFRREVPCQSSSESGVVNGNMPADVEGKVQTTAYLSPSQRPVVRCSQGIADMPEVFSVAGKVDDQVSCLSVAATNDAEFYRSLDAAAGDRFTDTARLRAISTWWTGCIAAVAVLQTACRYECVRPSCGRDAGGVSSVAPCLASTLVETVVDTAFSNLLDADTSGMQPQQQHRQRQRDNNARSTDQSTTHSAAAERGAAPLPFSHGLQKTDAREEGRVGHFDAPEDMETGTPSAGPPGCSVTLALVASVVRDGLSQAVQEISTDKAPPILSGTALPRRSVGEERRVKNFDTPGDLPAGRLLGNPRRSCVTQEFVATAIESGLTQATQVVSTDTARLSFEGDEQSVLSCGCSPRDTSAASPLTGPCRPSLTGECAARAIEEAYSQAAQGIAAAAAPPFTPTEQTAVGEERRAVPYGGGGGPPEAAPLSVDPSQRSASLEFVARVIEDGIIKASTSVSRHAVRRVRSVDAVEGPGKAPISLPSRTSCPTSTNGTRLELEGNGAVDDASRPELQQQARTCHPCEKKLRSHRIPVVATMEKSQAVGDALAPGHVPNSLQSPPCPASSAAVHPESAGVTLAAASSYAAGNFTAPSIHVRLPSSYLPEDARGATGISPEQHVTSPQEPTSPYDEMLSSPTSGKRLRNGTFVRITNVPVKSKPVAVVSADYDADGRTQKMQARAEARAKAGCVRLGLQCYRRHPAGPCLLQDDFATTAVVTRLPTMGAQEMRTGASTGGGGGGAGSTGVASRRAELVTPRATKSAGEARMCGSRVQLRKNRWCSPCIDGSVDGDDEGRRAPRRSTSRPRNSRENGGSCASVSSSSPRTALEDSPVVGEQPDRLILCRRPESTVGDRGNTGRPAIGTSSSCGADDSSYETARMIYGVAIGRGTGTGKREHRGGEMPRRKQGEEGVDDQSFDLASVQSSGRDFPRVSYKYKYKSLGLEWNPGGRDTFSSSSEIAASTTSSAIAAVTSGPPAERSTSEGPLRRARNNAITKEGAQVRSRDCANRSGDMSVVGQGAIQGKPVIDGGYSFVCVSGGRTGPPSPKPPTEAKARSFASSPREFSYRVSSCPPDTSSVRARCA